MFQFLYLKLDLVGSFQKKRGLLCLAALEGGRPAVGSLTMIHLDGSMCNVTVFKGSVPLSLNTASIQSQGFPPQTQTVTKVPI